MIKKILPLILFLCVFNFISTTPLFAQKKTTTKTAPTKQKTKTAAKTEAPAEVIDPVVEQRLKAREDSIKNLYSTYTLTIIPDSPLTDENAREIENVIKPLPTVYYCHVDPKTNLLVVQVRDTQDHRALVSSEIKQVVMDISGYDIAHGFSKEMKPRMSGN